jgi:hypothetical protein
MASDSSDGYRVDVRAIGKTLLQLSPIIAAVIYVLEYNYAFQFLLQFGVTPEEVGISEIKLLTRAALFTLIIASLFCLLFVGLIVLVGFLIAELRLIGEAWRSRRIPKGINLIEQSRIPHRRSIVESFREAYRRAQVVRISSALSFAIMFGIVILLVKVLGLTINTPQTLDLIACGVGLGAVLFAVWRKKTVRYLFYAFATVLVIAMLGWATSIGGVHRGYNTARTGQVPPSINALGIDILQVHPQWINEKVVPPQYTQDQDLLELGSDSATAFLYDCWTGTTYRIPLDDVMLTYPLYFNQTNSTIVRRLRCR